MHSDLTRHKARNLWREGKGVRAIAAECHVGLATASRWVGEFRSGTEQGTERNAGADGVGTSEGASNENGGLRKGGRKGKGGKGGGASTARGAVKKPNFRAVNAVHTLGRVEETLTTPTPDGTLPDAEGLLRKVRRVAHESLDDLIDLRDEANYREKVGAAKVTAELIGPLKKLAAEEKAAAAATPATTSGLDLARLVMEDLRLHSPDLYARLEALARQDRDAQDPDTTPAAPGEE